MPLFRQRRCSGLSFLLLLLAALFLTLPVSAATVYPTKLGDLDGDGVSTILDVIALINHINATPRLDNEMAVFADLDQDGVVNNVDVDLAVDVILGLREPLVVPLTRILDTSPADGASDVAVTRETIIRLTQPLSRSTLITPQHLYAEFGGRKLLSRVDLSSDRRKVTLFYLENLPGNARVRVTFNGNPFNDFAGRRIDADGDGEPGGVAAIDFDTLSLTSFTHTIVCGRVYASELATNGSGITNMSVNRGLAGVTITADGLEQEVRAVTDNLGDFRLTNAPAGHFFVHIDGRTLINMAEGIRWPDLRYYPYVGKEWESIPGGETNIGEVYLPLVSAGTLHAVSPTNDTVITFPTNVLAQHPELQGVTVTVPANALFSDNGTRGGMVGIAPVPPDRLPGRLPDGLNFPLVITLQTDGPSNFGQPVPVCFPNLSNALTGEPPLPPGAKSALWSFNHDTGDWEIVGPMTVSEDGRLVCSDPGVGILAPGWHGTQPGVPPEGGKPCAECPKPDPPPCEMCPCPGDDGNQCTKPINLFSGEEFFEERDLIIKGVGMDFVWSRTYGSRKGPNTSQGNGWDFSFNKRLFRSGSSIRICDGAYRDDLYRPQPNGTWGMNGFLRELKLNGDETLTLTLRDGTKWNFSRLDGTPQEGALQSIIDRNGNTMLLHYDGQGRLVRVSDTLQRNITIAYNANGFIESVSDFAGRSVRYSYYGHSEIGGSFGDLKSMTTPVVVGTPNGNDFPSGKTRTYTYTTGFADDLLNHNLISITDGRRNDRNDPTFGQGALVVNYYSSITDPNSIYFDRVVRQVWGGQAIHLTYERLIPAVETGEAVTKTILKDRNGNVKELFYDIGNRLVRQREYTGRADPNLPTTTTANRPIGKLRAGDPDFFETIYEYNLDNLPTRTIHPNGNITENIYESDLNRTVAVRARGNVREIRRLPGSHLSAGDQAILVERFEYDSDFSGCCGFNFVTKHTDARGNATLSHYDERGNLIARTNRIASIVERFTHNERGQRTSHTHPDNGTGHHRIDAYTYYDSGPQHGYLREEIIDFGGFNLTTRYEYDAVGNIVRKIVPRGQDTRYAVNQLDQVVREISPEVMPGTGVRYTKDFFHDANNNLVRIEVQNRVALEDGGGIVTANPTWTTTFEYEILNHLIRKREEVEADRFIITEYAYDENRNRILTRLGEATAGRQTNNVVQMFYDERDLLFRELRGPGSTQQSTTQFDYDGNRNRVHIWHGLEGHPHLTIHSFDSFNRLVSTTDAMGNITSNHYDANGNRTSTVVMGELEDMPGSANNVRLSETTWTLDAIDRVTRQDVAFFNATNGSPIGDGFATTQAAYSDNSQILAVINDNNHGKTNQYDTANRLRAMIDAKGNAINYEYDANSNPSRMMELEKSGVGGPDEIFTTTYTHDQLNRLISTTDNISNVNRSGYNSRDNRTITIDANTNVVHYVYDGLSRLTETIREMTGTGVGGSPVVDAIVTRQSWDDTSRLTKQIDDKTNSTTYIYDALNRKVATVYADGTAQTNWFDVQDNAILFTDANGNRVTNRYDANDRVIRHDIVPGPGVSPDTTFEVCKYDGLNRLTWAQDDDSVVIRGYDSLGRIIREVQRLTGFSDAVVTGTYDGVGNLTQCIYPGGRVITTVYDELERKKVISDINGLIAEYWFTGPSRVARRDFGNGTRCEYSYDGIIGVPGSVNDFGVKRIIRTKHFRIADGNFVDDRTYTWDRAGNKTQNKDVRPGGPQWQRDYAYDSIYQLTNSVHRAPTGAVESITYNLDGVGNRLSVIAGTDAGAYTMDATIPEPADRQMNQYTTTPFDTRSNDGNGNLVAINVDEPAQRSLAYDYRNRMVAHTNGAMGMGSTYAYDALGRRIQKNVGGGSPQTVRFVYQGWQEIEEHDSTGITQASEVYGLHVDELLTVRRGSRNLHYHADQLFNIIAVSDSLGEVLERYEYGDFGFPYLFNNLSLPMLRSAISNTKLFNGRRFDVETDLHEYRTRYLDSHTGRFVSRDVIGVWGDLKNLGNALAYVGNGPTTFIDPYGLRRQENCNEIYNDMMVKCSSDHQERLKVCANDPFGSPGGNICMAISEEIYQGCKDAADEWLKNCRNRQGPRPCPPKYCDSGM